jgi:hypothetical protein
MMCAVANTKTSEDSQRDGGVLANLPRTRPQRSSARRTAARGATANGGRARKPAQGKRSSANARKAVTAPAPGADVSAATKASAGAATKPKGKPHVRATRPAAATKRSRPPQRADARKRRAERAEDAAPRQGFEAYGESTGGSVQPPGGAEFVATAAEIVGELAKAGLSTGERLLKDVLSRLPLS